MLVSSILWINKDIFEAEIEVTDGKYLIVCFSCDKYIAKGDYIKGTLSAIDINEVRIIENNYSIQRIDSSFEQIINGRLSDNCSKINIGKMSININKSYIPGDIVDGDFIEGTISRVDICYDEMTI